MTKEAIPEVLLRASRQPVELVLTNGARILVRHADYVMFSPDTPELITYGERGSFKVVALEEIASLDVGPMTDLKS